MSAKAQNRDGGGDSCPICQDEGWVTLVGWTQVQGIKTERGRAPCKWCSQGEAAFRANPKCSSLFDIDEVEMPSPPPTRDYRVEGRRRLAELKKRIGIITRPMPDDEGAKT